MKRREFLSLAALGLVPRLVSAQPRALRLRASPAAQALVGAGNPATGVWAYNGTVPGPELRFKQGERLKIEVENVALEDVSEAWRRQAASPGHKLVLRS